MARPPKPAGTHYRTPVLVVGRVPASTQAQLRAVAAATGLTWTAWATHALERAAALERRRQASPLEKIAKRKKKSQTRETK